MLVKDTLLRESLATGYLKKAVARQLIKIGTGLFPFCEPEFTDVNKTSRIFDFLESSGWINKPSMASPGVLPPIYQPTQDTANKQPPS